MRPEHARGGDLSSPLADPFPAGPNVRAYVPSGALEQMLSYLEARLEAGPEWVGICGAPGVGKTLVLRLLLRRLAAHATPVYVPDASFSPAEIARWVGASLGGARGESLEAIALRLNAAGRPLTLGIDEGQLASEGLVASLDALCQAGTAARAVLAWSEFESGIPRALAGCRARVFVEALELSVVPHFVEAQLGRIGAGPTLRAALTGRVLDRIALASAGNPRRIQRLADAELAALAWRTRAPIARAPRPHFERLTVSAPRGPLARPEARARVGSHWRTYLLASLLVLAGAAIMLLR